MKHLLPLLLLIAGVGCTSKPTSDFRLEGKLHGVVGQGKAYLFPAGSAGFNAYEAKIDTTGRFVFNGQLPHPDAYELRVEVNDSSARLIVCVDFFYLEPGRLTYRARVRGSDAVEDEAEEALCGTLTGSATEDLYQSLCARLAPIERLAHQASERLQALHQDCAPDAATCPTEATRLQRQLDSLQRTKCRLVLDFVHGHASSIVALDEARHLLTEARVTRAMVDSLIAWLAPHWNDRSAYNDFDRPAQVKRNTTVGGSFPNHAFIDLQGDTVWLHNLLPPMRHSLIVFLSPSYSGSTNKQARLERWARLYPQLNLIVIAPTETIGHSSARPTSRKQPWTQLEHPHTIGHDLADVYGLVHTPAYFLLAPNGCVLAHEVQSDSLEQALQRLYAR